LHGSIPGQFAIELSVLVAIIKFIVSLGRKNARRMRIKEFEEDTDADLSGLS